MRLSTRFIVAAVGIACLIGAAFLWGMYSDMYIPFGFAGALLLGAAGTTEGKQVKE